MDKPTIDQLDALLDHLGPLLRSGGQEAVFAEGFIIEDDTLEGDGLVPVPYEEVGGLVEGHSATPKLERTWIVGRRGFVAVTQRAQERGQPIYVPEAAAVIGVSAKTIRERIKVLEADAPHVLPHSYGGPPRPLYNWSSPNAVHEGGRLRQRRRRHRSPSRPSRRDGSVRGRCRRTGWWTGHSARRTC